MDLIVTSPPYPMIEMWDDIFSSLNPEIGEALSRGDDTNAYRMMHLCLDEVWDECDRVLKPNGFVCINIGDATRTLKDDFKLYPNHATIVDYFLSHGYSVLPDIHWRKQSNSPNKFMGSGMYPAGAYVTYEHEYILVFRKGGKRVFSGEEKERRRRSAYFWEERNVWFSDLWEIHGTTQSIQKLNANRDRSAAYPFEVPYRLVNMYSVEGDTVLDPFAGMGTTSLACMAAARNSVGIEIDPTMVDIIYSRLLSSADAVNSAIDNRVNAHMAFIESLNDEKKESCYVNLNHGFKVKTRQETAIAISRLASIDAVNQSIICEYERHNLI